MKDVKFLAVTAVDPAIIIKSAQNYRRIKEQKLNGAMMDFIEKSAIPSKRFWNKWFPNLWVKPGLSLEEAKEAWKSYDYHTFHSPEENAKYRIGGFALFNDLERIESLAKHAKETGSDFYLSDSMANLLSYENVD